MQPCILIFFKSELGNRPINFSFFQYGARKIRLIYCVRITLRFKTIPAAPCNQIVFFPFSRGQFIARIKLNAVVIGVPRHFYSRLRRTDLDEFTKTVAVYNEIMIVTVAYDYLFVVGIDIPAYPFYESKIHRRAFNGQHRTYRKQTFTYGSIFICI